MIPLLITEAYYRPNAILGTRLIRIPDVSMAVYRWQRVVGGRDSNPAVFLTPGYAECDGVLFGVNPDLIEPLMDLTVGDSGDVGTAELYLCFKTADQGIKVKAFYPVVFGVNSSASTQIPWPVTLIETGVQALSRLPFHVGEIATQADYVNQTVRTMEYSQLPPR